MEMRRLHCLEARKLLVAQCLVGAFLSLLMLGCGSGKSSGEAQPPPRPTAIAEKRYERAQVSVDGKPVNASTTLTAGRDFDVTVSFRRRHSWPGMDNPESHIFALVMEKRREHTLTRRNEPLAWQSEKDGILTFTGTVDGLAESGVFGLWIEEAVSTETLGVERYFLFVENIRNVKQ